MLVAVTVSKLLLDRMLLKRFLIRILLRILKKIKPKMTSDQFIELFIYSVCGDMMFCKLQLTVRCPIKNSKKQNYFVVPYSHHSCCRHLNAEVRAFLPPIPATLWSSQLSLGAILELDGDSTGNSKYNVNFGITFPCNLLCCITHQRSDL